MLPPSVLLPPFARPPELGLQIVTCVKQHLIWSHRTRCRRPSVTRFWCFHYRPGRSVFVKKKGACERRAVALAVAIEVIKEGWNCRLWNRARSRLREVERRGEEGRERKIKTPNYPSELRRVRTDRWKGSPEKKEVRTICLAERHQLVWPVLSGTG